MADGENIFASMFGKSPHKRNLNHPTYQLRWICTQDSFLCLILTSLTLIENLQATYSWFILANCPSRSSHYSPKAICKFRRMQISRIIWHVIWMMMTLKKMLWEHIIIFNKYEDQQTLRKLKSPYNTGGWGNATFFGITPNEWISMNIS